MDSNINQNGILNSDFDTITSPSFMSILPEGFDTITEVKPIEEEKIELI